MFTRTWFRGFVALFAGAVFALLAYPQAAHAVGGVDELGLFELDGNATDNSAAGDDWQNVADGSDSATVVTHDGQFGIVFDTFDPVNMDDVLTGGQTKDENDIPFWAWKYAKPTPDKDNITNAYAAAYMNDGQLIIYFGADRFANNGDAMIGFWFFKSEVSEDGSTHTFNGNHVEGDVLVLTNFTNGGAVDTVVVYEWVTTGGDVSEHLKLIAYGGACNATGQDICARNNPGTETSNGEVAYWPYTPKFGTTGYFPMNSFFEGGVNISALFAGAVPCFTSFMAETRTSQSTDAVLKDFALSSFPLCGIEASKECQIVRQATTLDAGYDPTKPLYASATVTVTNTGVGALPIGTEICVDDNPTGNSTQPEIACLTLAAPLFNGTSKTFDFNFFTSLNPPENIAYVTATFDSQTLEAQTPLTECEGIAPVPGLFLEKDCTTALTLQSSLVAVKVNYGFRVCNTGEMPLSITLTDPKAGVDTVVVLDWSDSYCDVDADCGVSGECIENRCVNYPGFVTGGDVCATYNGYYLPSSVVSTIPCTANFDNTVTAHGVNTLFNADLTATDTANCPLCDQCGPQ